MKGIGVKSRRRRRMKIEENKVIMIFWNMKTHFTHT